LGDNDAMPLKHSFAPGVYVREIFIPKGSMLTGKIHRHSHPNFLMQGEVIVVTEFGGREHLKAPKSMISKAGTKRAIYAIEDTIWITVHVTEETDLKKIEEYVIAPTYDALKAAPESKELESELAQKNCLILALKKRHRDYRCLLELDPVGLNLPFLKAIRLLKKHQISVNGLYAYQKSSGIWHVEAFDGETLDSLILQDDHLVGTWVAVAVAVALIAAVVA